MEMLREGKILEDVDEMVSFLKISLSVARRKQTWFYT